MTTRTIQILLISLTFIVLNDALPCPELSSALRIPCSCKIEGKSYIGVDCNQVVFTSEIPSIPYNAPVSTFSQRHSGLQSIPTQVIYKRESYSYAFYNLNNYSLNRFFPYQIYP